MICGSSSVGRAPPCHTFNYDVLTVSANANATYRNGRTTNNAINSASINATNDADTFNITFTPQIISGTLRINLNDGRPFLQPFQDYFDKGRSIGRRIFLENVGDLVLKYRLCLSDIEIPFINVKVLGDDEDPLVDGTLGSETVIEGSLAVGQRIERIITLTMTDNNVTGFDSGLIEFKTTVWATQADPIVDTNNAVSMSANVPSLQWYTDTQTIKNSFYANLYNGSDPAWCLCTTSPSVDNLTMSVPEGYKIMSVKINYTALNNGVLKDSNSNPIFSGQSYRFDKREVLFSINGSIDGGGDGQIYITAIQVEYIKIS